MRVRPVLLLIIAGTVSAFGQYPEDALRLSTPGYGVGARALGLGNAYSGVANDFSAIYWNPAGLGQMTMGEFSVGLAHLNTVDDATYLGNTVSSTGSGTAFNSFGIAHPIPVRRGSLVLAFGFTRQSMYTSSMQFSGYNPSGSIVQVWAPDGEPLPPEVTIAEDLELADTTAMGTFYSPIKGDVTQSGTVTESGGLNNWSGAGAVEFAKDFYGGVTLTYLAGSYRYDRTYNEQDSKNVYAVYPYDFASLVQEDYIDGEISGFGATFGLLYRVPERFRLGITVKVPTAYWVRERYGSSYASSFDNGDRFTINADGHEDAVVEYDVHTPWVFGGGASLTLGPLLLSGDVEATDWTTMEFTNTNSDLEKKNKEIATTFRSTLDYRVGAELDLFNEFLRLRAGYGLHPSPYKDDPPEYDRKTISGGIGIRLAGDVMLDAAYSRANWKTYRVNYEGSPHVDENVVWNTFMATLSYRF
jgi:long-subunit fatty acid transport protein